MLLLWVQYLFGIYHGWGEVFLLIAGIGTIFGDVAFLLGLYRAIRGPRRRKSFEWGLVAMIPLLLWGIFAYYMISSTRDRRVPYNSLHLMGRIMGASMMELEARYLYPSRLEADHFVMFYDERVPNPQEDLQQLEAFMVHLEQMTGRKFPQKPYLVRGRTMGRGRVCVNGICMGSVQSPATSLDRHELSHAVMYQLAGIKADPPFLFVEGWAEMLADGGKNFLSMYREGSIFRMGLRMQFQGENRPDDSILKELVSPPYYHIDEGAVYPIGGLFVGYLVDHYGVAKFIDLYAKVSLNTFLDDFKAMYGIELEVMEKEFWKEVDERAKEIP